ncbi:DNA repair protein rad51c [Blyttiomyces sp. JEL0837]|nr:DNA repair protein rad51c [Blyttiomyces sp. JEL0837]
MIDGFQSITAFQALQQEKARFAISTSSKQFDEMLGGGVQPGRVLELCGPPGVGKTQIVMQLAVNCQRPSNGEDDAGCEVIFIDTEGSFMGERTLDMGKQMISEIMTARLSSPNSPCPEITLNSILENIHYYRVYDHLQQVALMNQLPSILEEKKRVKLVIIDSVAFHFRQGFNDMGLRSRLLNGMAQTLRKVADQFGAAVVMTNQMTTQIIKVGSIEKSSLVPALGESWGHACTVRVLLFWKHNVRHALLAKSPNMPERIVKYDVTSGGITDHVE